jgi:hypothetical protein
MRSCDWAPPTTSKLVGFALGFSCFLLLIFCSQPGFVPVLDHANLLFHEAGHPLVGLFSTRLEPYGGTIGQLLFPATLVVIFWRRGEAFGVATGGLWFFENWFNIARYLADARNMELPLVGGGDHDWNTILLRWNLLPYDTSIASVMRVIAWVGIAVTCAWVLWRTVLDRRHSHGPETAFALTEG